MNRTFTKFGMIVAFMLSFLSASAFDFKVDGIYYTVTDLSNLECKVVSGWVEYNREVVIPSTVTDNSKTFSVVSIDQRAFSLCGYLTSVTIPNSVTSIGAGAFDGCSSLTSITIPNSVTSIGWGAFYGCSSLTSITIPNSVTSIGDNTFLGCSSLTSVTIPDSVTSIGERAFYRCRSLTSVTIGNSVTGIGKSAFEDCNSLTSVMIGNSVTSIGERAFYGCSSLTSVTIPDSVTSIGEWIFYDCSSLTSVMIGNSVTSIGERAFFECSSLTSVMIGNSVTSIGIQAFIGCSSLTSVTIPDSVTRIGALAFENCSSLTSVKLSENLELIEYGTFCGCSKLESIEIPGSVKEIVQYKNYYTFSTYLKRLVLKYSADLLVSSKYSWNASKNIETDWYSTLTKKLEEVFLDRQMKYSMSLPNVKILSFGEHLKEVQVEDIQNCENLDTIVCYGTEPPTLPECSNKQYMNVVVKVPQEALEKYQQAENWKNFWNLQGFDPAQSGVDEIPVSSVEKVETGRYNLNGQRVGEDYQGIVIVRYSDGSTRKLIYHK